MKSVRQFCSILASGLVLVTSALQLAPGQQSPGYKVLRTMTVGGKGGWDYIAVNPELKRIYLSHDSLVNILDETSGASVGVIPNTPGVHGIAFAPPYGKGYTSNGRSNTATVFNLESSKILREIATGKNPDAITYDPFSKKIFTCNGRSQDGTVIDPATDSVVATVPLGGKPEAAVSDGAGNIYVNIEDKNEIVHINSKSWTVEHRWSLSPGESPTGLALDIKAKRLFAGCDKKLVVVSTETGKVVTQLPIGDRCDGVAFDPSSGDVFTSNGEGTITVIHEASAESFSVTATVPTKRGARTIILDGVTHHLFLPAAEYEPAAPATAENPRPRPRVVTGSFHVLEVGR